MRRLAKWAWLFLVVWAIAGRELDSQGPFTYYVSVGGHGETSVTDANSCTAARNINTPKRNFGNTNGALKCLAAGDTLLVRGGNYNEAIELGSNNTTIAAGTSWSNKVRIAAYPNGCSPTSPHTALCGTPGELVYLNPVTGGPLSGVTISMGLAAKDQYIEWDGINIDASVRPVGGEFAVQCDAASYRGGNYIRFKNAETIGPYGDPTLAMDACCCPCPQTAGTGIQLYKDVPTAPHANCPGGHEIQNVWVHKGGEVTAGWTPGGRYTAYGFYITADNVLVEDSVIEDRRYIGFNIASDHGPTVSGTVIRRNIVKNMTKGGYPTPGSRAPQGYVLGNYINNALIYDNLAYDNGNADGMYDFLGYTGSGNKWYNNTAYNSTGIAFYYGLYTNSNTVRSNIADGSGQWDYQSEVSDTQCNTNSFACANGVSAVNTGPSQAFRDVTTHDFHLTSASPGRNTGVDFSGIFNTDFDGIIRPQEGLWDKGAFEFVSGGGAPSTPVNVFPFSTATHVRVQPTLRWNASGATTYYVYGDPSNPPTNLWANAITGTNVVATLAGAPSTLYYWYVRACNGANCVNSPTWTFTTGPTGEFAYDTFTDTAGVDVLLTPHYGQNANWLIKPSSDGSFVVDANGAVFGSIDSGTNALINDVNAPDTTYTITCTLRVVTVTSFAGCGGYTKTTSPEGYFVFYDANADGIADNTWQLLKIQANGGLNSVSGAASTCAQTLTPGQTYTATLKLTPNSQVLTITGGTGCSLTGSDTELTGVNSRVSVIAPFSTAVTSTTGIHIDSIAAVDDTPALPSTPSSPSPADGATGVPVSVTLTWVTDGTNCDRYFGLTNPPPFVSNGSCVNFTPGTLTQGTMYYWSVVSYNATGSATGPVWSLTSVNPPAAGIPARMKVRR